MVGHLIFQYLKKFLVIPNQFLKYHRKLQPFGSVVVEPVAAVYRRWELALCQLPAAQPGLPRSTDGSPNKSACDSAPLLGQVQVKQKENVKRKTNLLVFFSLYISQKAFYLFVKCLQNRKIILKRDMDTVWTRWRWRCTGRRYLFPALGCFLLCPSPHIFYPFS